MSWCYGLPAQQDVRVDHRADRIYRNGRHYVRGKRQRRGLLQLLYV